MLGPCPPPLQAGRKEVVDLLLKAALLTVVKGKMSKNHRIQFGKSAKEDATSWDVREPKSDRKNAKGLIFKKGGIPHFGIVTAAL